jgi:hypothetical protein
MFSPVRKSPPTLRVKSVSAIRCNGFGLFETCENWFEHRPEKDSVHFLSAFSCHLGFNVIFSPYSLISLFPNSLAMLCSSRVSVLDYRNVCELITVEKRRTGIAQLRSVSGISWTTEIQLLAGSFLFSSTSRPTFGPTRPPMRYIPEAL